MAKCLTRKKKWLRHFLVKNRDGTLKMAV